MKILFFIFVALFSFDLTAHQGPQISKEILDSSEESVLGVIAGRAYLRPEKLMYIEGEWFLQNDLQQLLPLGRSMLQDSVGYYLYAAGIECPNGHTGFKKVNGIWYCFNNQCYYFFGNHF